ELWGLTKRGLATPREDMRKPANTESESRAVRTERERLEEVGAAAAYSAVLAELIRRVGSIDKITEEDALEVAEHAWKLGHHFAWERLKAEPNLGSGDD